MANYDRREHLKSIDVSRKAFTYKKVDEEEIKKFL